MKAKKRFISGAICPSCQAKDTLCWWKSDQVEWVECVVCGHKDNKHVGSSVSASGSAAEKTNRTVKDNQKVKDDGVIGIFKPD